MEGWLRELKVDKVVLLRQVASLEGQLTKSARCKLYKSSQEGQQQDMAMVARTVSQDMETLLGDRESLLQRLAGMDSGLKMHSSLLEAECRGHRGRVKMKHTVESDARLTQQVKELEEAGPEYEARLHSMS